MSGRKYDIILFGATSSVGVEIVRYLARLNRAQPKWAIAGRSAKPLEELAKEAAKIAGPDRKAPDVLLADVKDLNSLKAMCKQTAVLLTTVGPYVQYGETVIQACIAEKTSYADITGEVPWVSQMKQKYDEAAAKAGVHILSFCGYDSIPSELSVYASQQLLKENGGIDYCESFHQAQGGGFPTGTVETILHGVSVFWGKVQTRIGMKKREEKKEEKNEWRKNPGLVPDTEKKAVARDMPSLLSLISWSPQIKAFTPVHFMAAINNSVVHSAAANLGFGGMRYSERLVAAGVKGHSSPMSLFGLIPTLITLFLYTFIGICAGLGILRPVAKVLNMIARRSRPSTHVTTVATSKDGKARSTVSMNYPGDPGILFTAVLCAEVALLLLDKKAVKGEPGFSTPAVAMGDALLARLPLAGVLIEKKVQKL